MIEPQPKRFPSPLVKGWTWLQERVDIQGAVWAALHVTIPRGAKTYFLGGLTLFFLGVQVVTGVLLTFYYRPTPDGAYQSVLYIMNEAHFGWLIRSIHAWSANFMIASCVLHLLRIFVQAAYKKPRELTWIVGIALLLITMGFGFTGYLLPWDQRAYWATTVGTEIAGSVPLIGKYLKHLLRGGDNLSGLTLSRFYGIHTLVLPLSIVLFVIIHLLLIHQQGLAPAPTDEEKESEVVSDQPADNRDAPETQEKKKDKKFIPFFPNYLLDEVIAWYIALAALITLASLFPAGLEDQADPLRTPAHIKPEWYFLFLYQTLKLVSRTAGVLIPGVGILLLLLVPFLDRGHSRRIRDRKFLIGFSIVVITAIASLTAWGWLS